MTIPPASSPHLRRVRYGFPLLVAIAALTAIATVTWSAAAPASPTTGQEKTPGLVDDWWRNTRAVPPTQSVPALVDDWWRNANGYATAQTAPVFVDDWWRDTAPPVAAVPVGNQGFDWADALIGAAVALAVAAVAGPSILWATHRHRPRHPRGPALPTT